MTLVVPAASFTAQQHGLGVLLKTAPHVRCVAAVCVSVSLKTVQPETWITQTSRTTPLIDPERLHF